MSTRFACLLVLSFLVASLGFTTVADAQTPLLPEAIAVVTDPLTLSRTGAISTGEVMILHVMLLDMDGGPFDGIRSIQFGLDLDPRLTLLTQTYSSWVTVGVNPAPGEYVLAGTDCLYAAGSPKELMSFLVMPNAGVIDLADLEIGLRGVDSRGEPMLMTDCYAADAVLPTFDAGGSILNPSVPRAVYLNGAPNPVVEGRDYTLIWGTHGATSAFLDSAPSTTYGTQIITAATPTTHELMAVNGPDADVRTHFVDVIREPRVDRFTAELLDTGPSVKILLRWSVVGATEVTVDGQGRKPAIGSMTRPINSGPGYLLTATNEWGLTSAQAHSPADSTSPPVIADFSANPATFAPGQPVDLNFTVFFADDVSISPDVGAVDPLQGSVQVTPVVQTTYTITATNVNGTETASVVVSPGPPLIQVLAVAPNPFVRTQDVTVTWQVLGADTVTLDHGIGSVAPVSGQLVHEFSTGDPLILTATNAHGSSTRAVDLLLREPVISLFQHKSFETVYPGQLATLQYAFTQGMSGEIQPGVGPVPGWNGAALVTPTTNGQEYTLTASVGDTVLTATTQVFWSPPSLNIQASDLTPDIGDTVTLDIYAGHADSVRVAPGIGYIGSTGGQVKVVPFVPTTYTATAINVGGITERSVTITPNIVPVVLSLTASSTNPAPGQEFTLHATAAHADSLWLEPGFGLISPTGGDHLVSIQQATTFTLTGSNPGHQTSVSLEIVPRQPTANLAAIVAQVAPGGTAELRVVVDAANSVFLEPHFGQIAGSGIYSTVINETTTFVLTATSPVGTVVDSATVEIAPPLIGSFRALDDLLVVGESTNLVWSSLRADQVSIAGTDGSSWSDLPGSGSIPISPVVATTYTLTLTNALGSVQGTQLVEVVPFEIKSFAAIPPNVSVGSVAVLSWEVAGTASVELVGYGSQPMVGALSVILDETTVFELVATDGVLEERRTTQVNVVPADGTRTLALSWSPTGYQSQSGYLDPNVLSNLYLISQGVVDGMNAFEAAIDWPVGTFLSIDEYIDMPNPLNFGTDNNLIVGIGGCRYVTGTDWLPLMRMTLFNFSGGFQGQYINLLPSSPSSFAGLYTGYSNCASSLRAFDETLGVYAGFSGVGTVNIPLESAWVDQGLQLSWKSQGLGVEPDEVRILRRTSQGLTKSVATVVDPEDIRQGQWLDAQAYSLTQGGVELYYQVTLVAGDLEFTSQEHKAMPTPQRVVESRLLSNLPNPFNPSTELRWELAHPSDMRLAIYDLAGRKLRSWSLPQQPMGPGSMQWDGTDERGQTVASGVYIVRMEAAGRVDARRITLLK